MSTDNIIRLSITRNPCSNSDTSTNNVTNVSGLTYRQNGLTNVLTENIPSAHVCSCVVGNFVKCLIPKSLKMKAKLFVWFNWFKKELKETGRNASYAIHHR